MGQAKIRQGLLQRQIPDAIIRIALQEIDSEEYALTLAHLLDQKAAMLPPDEPGQRTQKLFAYAASRGYETELIWEFLKEKNR